MVNLIIYPLLLWMVNMKIIEKIIIISHFIEDITVLFVFDFFLKIVFEIVELQEVKLICKSRILFKIIIIQLEV